MHAPVDHPAQTIFEQSITDCANGRLTHAAIRGRLTETAGVLSRLASQAEAKTLPHFTIPYRTDDLDEQAAVAERIVAECSQVVVLGTGGSSLGPQAIAQLVQTPFGGPADRPRVGFLDNLDPIGLAAALATCDLANTHFLVASKSGSTAETIAQLLIVIDALEQAGYRTDAIGRHFTVVTEPRDNLLRNLARRFGARVLDHDPDLGGRYAVLSVIGTLPALILGLDAAALRRGAARTLEQNLHAIDPSLAPAAVGAAVSIAADDCGLPQTVMFGYGDRLERLAAWWRQLWAESLGKHGKGTTPITAVGPVDQHSQLQLYLDGPDDKLFTVVDLATKGQGPVIRTDLADDPSLAFLAGRQIGDIVAAQARSTGDTLVKFSRPVRRLTIPRYDEEALGSLFMHFTLETLIAAGLIGVDPFDQPAVEDGKILTRQYLLADKR
ncbi:glucose-6-phosphate isomerase [Zavarzinia compransoris]|nr:glucose-6-phosphate isomerase [Zavarzinia compransoris]TDP47767.1 glucose-6-phosphate isomerase [Zavarzinia compransoris]